ncbi:hypothetical protein LUX12_05860 [Streptomyces somaliensis]|uniref:hypothetical protein n=1 Tax=Streptomyces somaliensis TaxID=78355 RepID=UPI0020CD6D47|nr:hypothetical protein [Streptomyces somaliensis]MCP9944422.1 hypothetical protein [Streptomyces somaliensis]MCP9962347.1 hypothetical protein [Streptomyces somaliensis]MCP9975166.1 hypothetical protein [Streptomyces somaliensis]
MTEQSALVKRIRVWLVFLVVCLVLSGVTAFPLVAGARLAHDALTGWASPVADALPGLPEWAERVRTGLEAADSRYPFLLYGTDRLAFAHLVAAVAFHGPYRDPVRNVWVVDLGLIACAGIVPLALVCGPIRGIPLWWSLADASFGVLGAVPLLAVRRHIKRLEALTEPVTTVRRTLPV